MHYQSIRANIAHTWCHSHSILSVCPHWLDHRAFLSADEFVESFRTIKRWGNLPGIKGALDSQMGCFGTDLLLGEVAIPTVEVDSGKGWGMALQKDSQKGYLQMAWTTRAFAAAEQGTLVVASRAWSQVMAERNCLWKCRQMGSMRDPMSRQGRSSGQLLWTVSVLRHRINCPATAYQSPQLHPGDCEDIHT